MKLSRDGDMKVMVLEDGLFSPSRFSFLRSEFDLHAKTGCVWAISQHVAPSTPQAPRRG
jgi:hypothetical protein